MNKEELLKLFKGCLSNIDLIKDNINTAIIGYEYGDGIDKNTQFLRTYNYFADMGFKITIEALTNVIYELENDKK